MTINHLFLVDGLYAYAAENCFQVPLIIFKKEEFKGELNFSDEIILIMKRNSLSIYTNSKKFEIYSNIPIEKPLYPAVILKDKNDTLEILNYKKEYYNNNDSKNKQ